MLKEKVRRTIVRYRMLEPGDRLVVAVSGGPDSVALLSILACLSQELNFSLQVAHLNHMFRAKEAEEDALYVKELAKKFSLPITVRKRNVLAFIKRKHLSPEEGARQVRYKFLQDVAEKAGANKIALGQTADDQAETVLIWMLRGSGLKGLTGIPAVRPLENSLIIRPLIEVSRSEIEDYLREEGLAVRVDASNLKPVYLRNKIRLKLIPLLARDYNPNIKSVLSGMSQILRADEECLNEVQERTFKRIVRVKGDNRVEINLISLRRR
ncbi:tRNA lysidine(34) synthetase TilS, partial [bacterium]|nr:tRNA lysidine(34) synthetase TilS [bacterium]